TVAPWSVGALEPAEAEDRAVRLALDDPEGEAEVALVAEQPLIAGGPVLERLNTAQPARDRGGVHDVVESKTVGLVPSAHPQPLGFGGDLSHSGPRPHEPRRRAPRRHAQDGCGSRGWRSAGRS